ncbi:MULTISPECIES: hypothetical protein [unclassified Pseudomonas]|uniref:hypothetical protein n=1 Tax=unclassified Pseudomonas TaxID=196821 RepID=UPI0004BC3273|nr:MULTISPECIES: hypothetical protein [unclassified Pseudomonas]SME91125.1 hypothetical protein SAMN05660912_00360 [Pseudomonas sp. LAMO17WK12:I1]
MKQFTSPSVPPVTGRPVDRPSGAAPSARTAFPVVDFAGGPLPPEAIPVRNTPSAAVPSATYQRMTDLPTPPAVTRDAIFAALGDPIPAPDPATGLREYDSRTYLNLDDGTTVLAVRDPQTGEWRERLPDSRLPQGPALHRVPQTNTWRSHSAASSSSSSPSLSHSPSASSLSHSASSSSLTAPLSSVSLSATQRIDPVWDLGLYTLPVSPAPTNTLAFPGKRAFMIGAEQYFMDANYGNPSGAVPNALPHLFAVGAGGNLVNAGRIEPDGLFRLNDNRHYLPVDTGFCSVSFDSARLRWKVMEAGGHGGAGIFIEMGGAPDSWVPMLAVDQLSNLFQAARNIKGYAGRVGAVDLLNSSIDQRVYHYMQGYLRQIVGFCEPTVRSAPTAQKGRLIDAYIWRNGYPYDCLASICSALKSRRPLPPGMPIFDGFQGLGTVSCSKDGNFNVARISRTMQLHYPDRRRSVAEEKLLETWREKDAARDNKRKGEVNEAMYEARLTEDGYTVLPGGTYGGGQNGFDRVFEGPAGDIYILEAKHVSHTSAGELANVSLGGTTNSRQMTDSWVRQVLALSQPDTPAARRVSDALWRGQLFKLLGATSKDGKLVMFKIDMSPVDF